MKVASFLLVAATAVVSAEEEWATGKVVMLGDEDWDDYRANNPRFLSVFFAPWCGHCKALKEPYAEAADELQFRAPLVAVDCTAEGKDTCSKFDVSGFPTLKWFGSSEGEAEAFEGGRTASDIVKWVNDKVGDEPENFDDVDFNTFKIRQLKKLLFDRGQTCKGCTEKHDFVAAVKASIHLPKSGPPAKKKKKGAKGSSLVNGRTVAGERRWKAARAVADEGWEENGQVVHLVEDDFQAHRVSGGATFTMFYAPWCGHCKELKPKLAEASEALAGVVSITAVDCVTNSELCRKYKVSSYPVLKFFPDADVDSKGEEFNGGRTAKGITKWLRKRVDANYEDVVEPFENEAVWEDNGAVVHMTEEHWDVYRADHPKMLVMFYAPWCGHCKAMKPDWATASGQTELPILAVDCTVHTGLCSKFDVSGYPTIKYFDTSDGDPDDYNDGRKLEDFISFANSKIGSDADADYKEEL